MQMLQIVISGLAQGCIYGLVALGFVLIYKATETVNFAQGELMMLGAFAGLILTNYMGISFWLAVPLAMCLMAMFGAGLERVAIRPVLGEPAVSIIMLTFGLAYILRGAVTMVPGIGTETSQIRFPLQGRQFEFAGLVLDAAQVMILVATLSVCLLLYAMFRYTRLGVAMQAASQNQLAAYYMGIPVRRINGVVWALAAAVAAFAGLMLAPITFVHANMGLIGLKAFPAAVVGGFGSLPGAIVGGLIIGVVETLSGFLLPEGFKDVSAYLTLLVVLFVRPHGLFGENLRKRV